MNLIATTSQSRARSAVAAVLAITGSIILAAESTAAVERYKSEALYLARLAQLGYATVHEGFEGAAWDGARTVGLASNYVPSLTSQRILWQSAGSELWPIAGTPAVISTTSNWARGPGWGIFDNYLASSLRIVAPEAIYGVGLWVRTNPVLQDVGFLFEGRTTANDPGYVLPGWGAMYPGDNAADGHSFIGIIDPDGFTSVVITGTLELNEENQLEGACVYGADDFTFGVAPGFLPTPLEAWRTMHFSEAELNDPASEATVWGVTANPDNDSLSNDAEFALGTDPNDPSDGDGDIVSGAVVESGHTLLILTFRRRNDDADLTILPQRSDNLTGWASGPTAFEEISSVDQGDGYDLVTVREVPAATARVRTFARLSINRSAP